MVFAICVLTPKNNEKNINLCHPYILSTTVLSDNFLYRKFGDGISKLMLIGHAAFIRTNRHTIAMSFIRLSLSIWDGCAL